jgi:hypothetical protein
MMSMSKKDYEAVARILSDSRAISDAALPYLAEKFADWFADDNPRFDRERFLKACGLGRGSK